MTRPSTPDDCRGIAEGMARTFGLPLSAPAIQPAMQDWKYWRRHPLSGAAPRSLIRNSLSAHVGMWPCILQSANGPAAAIHPIDWFSDHRTPGAGIAAMMSLLHMYPLAYVTGRSDIADRVLPKLGFSPNAPMVHFLPPAQFFSRLLRRPVLPAGWHLESCPPAAIPSSMFPARPSSSLRTPELFAHLAACPALPKLEGTLVCQAGTPRAYFVTATVKGEARLADHGPDTLDEEQARIVALAASGAVDKAITCDPALIAGFHAAGWVEIWSQPILVRGFADSAPIRITLLDSDGVYL